MSIRFSLVFPLVEERGLTTEALAAWAHQTMPGDRFEVIVVADQASPVGAEIRSLLRSHDQVVVGSFGSIAHQFDAGVRAGSGDYLFLTESHCKPALDCLEEMDRYLLANPALAGACCESIPEWKNAYQFIDAMTFEEGYRLFLQTNDWRKLSVHGMALHRDLYLSLGGLQHQYGRYAEMLLAATLRDAGKELGYARKSVVVHTYRETLRELIDGTEEYVTSECSYRAANPGPDRVGHSYLPVVSNPFSAGATALEREVIETLLDGILGGSSAIRRLVSAHLGSLVLRPFGRRAPLVRAWLALTACRLRCWWDRHSVKRVEAPYRELIRLAAIRAYVQHLATRPAIDPPLPEPSPALPIERFPESALHGFHGIERYQNQTFRWTAPVAAMRLPLRRGDYRLRLMTGGIRKEDPRLRVAFNGLRLHSQVGEDGAIELQIERKHCRVREQTLILVTDPIRPWQRGVKDYRELGLPLIGIEAVPVAQSRQPTSRAA